MEVDKCNETVRLGIDSGQRGKLPGTMCVCVGALKMREWKMQEWKKQVWKAVRTENS